MSGQPGTAHDRHAQPCERGGLTLAELHALAGRWSAYPAHETTSPRCPVCGEAVPPMRSYCDRACYIEGQKRSYRVAAQAREADEFVGYNDPPPKAR